MHESKEHNAAVFNPETFRFFRELGRNNKKEWMDVNRDRYRAYVVEPFRALLERLAPSVRKLDSGFTTSGRTGENFARINRDIRFSKDKTPYWTHMYLFFANQLSDEWQGAQLYVGVAPEAVTAGFRIYGDMRSKSSALHQLGRPRGFAHPKWIERQARRLGRRFDSYWYSAERGEWKKHDGWPTHPEEWKKLQGWIVRRKMKPAAASRPSFVGDVTKIFRDVFPLYEFTCAKPWKP